MDFIKKQEAKKFLNFTAALCETIAQNVANSTMNNLFYKVKTRQINCLTVQNVAEL